MEINSMKLFSKEKFENRLKHDYEHLQIDWIDNPSRKSMLENRIINNESNFSWCFMSLQDWCVLNCIKSWFHDANIEEFRNYAYNFSKLQYIIAQPQYSGLKKVNIYEGIWVLMSNYKPIIEWYANLDQAFGKSIENPRLEDFFIQQFFIALRGEWSLLKQNCELVLSEGLNSNTEESFLDYKFLLALSIGDTNKMIEAILQLMETKRFNRRQKTDIETGYTRDLIDTTTTLYAKLAWYHGYQIKIDTPYIPQEWLPMKPLEEYHDELDFMKNYKI